MVDFHLLGQVADPGHISEFLQRRFKRLLRIEFLSPWAKSELIQCLQRKRFWEERQWCWVDIMRNLMIELRVWERQERVYTLLDILSVRFRQNIAVYRPFAPYRISIIERSYRTEAVDLISFFLSKNLHKWLLREILESALIDDTGLFFKFWKDEVHPGQRNFIEIDFWVVFDSFPNKTGERVLDIVTHVKWTFDLTGIEQIWMIAYFSELHKNVHNAKEITVM